MPQNTITKALLSSAAILAHAKGQPLPTLPRSSGEAPELAPTPAPAPGPATSGSGGINIDALLLPAPCLSAIETCAPPRSEVNKALVLPAPAAMTRAKHVEGGLRMQGCPKIDFNVPVVFGDAEGRETMNLLFDTGSGALGVLADGAATMSFDRSSGNITLTPEPGPTFHKLPSTHLDGNSTEQTYGSGYWDGLVAYNKVGIKGWPKMTMGTGEIILEENSLGGSMFRGSCDLEGNVKIQHQGILGMDTGNYQQPDMDEYWTEVSSTVKDNSFSLALCDINGTLVQGKPHAKYLASEFVYARYQAGFYGNGIETTGIRVGEQNLAFTNADFGQTMVDSGSTSVTLPSPVVTALAEQFAVQTGVAAWRNIIATNGCFAVPDNATRADLDASLPTITLQVRDPDDLNKINELTFSASNFLLTMLPSVDGTMKACSFLTAGEGPMTVLGNIANVGNWINHGHGVGFAKAKDVCEDLA